MQFRSLNWEADADALRKLDTSFVIDRIYTVSRDDLSISLSEEVRTPCFTKRYGCTLTKEQLAAASVAIGAFEEERLLGYAVVAEEAWNRRAVLTDFFVDRKSRRSGIGRKMLAEILKLLPERSRVLWVETQNVNFPAIAFYREMGFDVCGFDSTLYDGEHATEVAVFLSKSLEKKRPNKSPQPTPGSVTRRATDFPYSNPHELGTPRASSLRG